MKIVPILVLILLALGMLVAYPIRISSADHVWPPPTDFNANFDNFLNGVTNPFPWSFFNGTNGATGATDNTQSHSPPNSFLISSSTYSGNNRIQAVFNATSSFVNATVWVYKNHYTTAGVNITIAGATGTFTKTASVSNNTWTKESLTAPQIASLTFTVIIATFCTGGCSGSGNFWFDDFSILSGAALLTNSGATNNYNFATYNESSAGPYWFDPSNYPGSRLVLNFPGGSNDSNQWANAPLQGLELADVRYANLATSSLITLYIGNFYTRTLIPDGLALNMFVDNPTSVQAYTISVIAPTNYYGAGSQIAIQQNNRNITSGYLSSTSQFSTYLIPGTYTVMLSDGVHALTETQTFPSTTSAVTIDAYSIVINTPSGIVTSLEWSAGWSSSLTSIIFNYWDNTSTTTSINLQVMLQNGSGTFTLFSNTYPISSRFAQITIPANSATLNKNLSSGLYMAVVINSSYFGTNFSLGTQSLTSCTGCIFPSNPSLPATIGGLNAIFPNLSWLNLISFLALLFTAGGFGLFQSRIGFVIMMFEAIFFWFAGWLPVTSLFISVFVALSVLGLIAWYRRN